MKIGEWGMGNGEMTIIAIDKFSMTNCQLHSKNFRWQRQRKLA
jgi:hypothetical protein